TTHTPFFSNIPAARPAPPSFPTRRSSDLATAAGASFACGYGPAPVHPPVRSPVRRRVVLQELSPHVLAGVEPVDDRVDDPRGARSEEHTSELQSRENLVCRLLLENKNNTR